MYKSLAVEKAAHVAEVVLTGPGKGNAMGPDFWAEMPGVFDTLANDEDTRCIIIRGSGKTFSYGLDLTGMMESLTPHLTGENHAAERGKLHRLILSMQDACNAIARCRKPVLAAIHGHCIGGGLDVISACDMRYCSKEAVFSLREVKLAIVADVGSLQRLPPIIGQGMTRELALTGKDIGAERALNIGLVNDVLESPEALLEHVRKVAKEIAGNPPQTVQGIKQVLNESVEPDIQAGLRHVAAWNASQLQSKDMMEAITAFMERRPPVFVGR